MHATPSPVALVTGTSSGIGLSTAIALAKAGFHTVATMRDLDRGDALRQGAAAAGVDLTIARLDVQDQASIDACLAAVLDGHGRIDVLVNNAGAGFLGSVEQTTMADLQATMDVNFYGVWRLTQAVLPAMRQRGSGRIITVSSVGGLIGQPFNDAYCAAKFAVEGMMESLAPVAHRFGIRVSLIEPGPVNTGFVGAVATRMAAAGTVVDAAYEPLVTAYREATREVFASRGQTPEAVAAVVVRAATDAEPHLRYPTSELMAGIIGQKYVDPTGDSVVALTSTRLQPADRA